jgi:hypothetical protein
MQYFLKQFCCLSLIKLHMVQGVNNVQKCLITTFSSLTTKLGRCHPNVCTAETRSQLLTATSYRSCTIFLWFFVITQHAVKYCANSPVARISAQVPAWLAASQIAV